jgi:hypothetical protein
VANGVGVPIRLRRSIETHELALSALGVGTIFSLVLATGRLNAVLVEVFAASSLYTLVILGCRSRTDNLGQRIRILASYLFVVWFYCAVARITPALGTMLRDPRLLAIDEAMFGHTPAIFCQRAMTPRLTDLMSLCYMTYHLYLPIAVAHAIVRPNSASRRLALYLFTGFALGFAGYLLVPAIGPARAFPELFYVPLTGGTPTRLIAQVVSAGSSGYDVFPSLHLLITCILLDHDWREVRRRFWIMLLPAVGLVASTIYLRYHYAVDLIAAFLLFLLLRQTFLKAAPREIALPD